jgi:hypothetical protein
MANKKINELVTRTPSLSDLILVGDPSSGYSYKATVTALATIIETDIADGFVTLSTTQTISGAKTFSNNLTLTSVANAATTQTKFLTLNASNVVNYRTGAEVLADIGGQGTLTLTTTGTSGAATLVGNTLNIPQYTDQYVGTVTSVAMTVPTGLTVSGTPITSSGTLAVSLQSGYSIPTTASQANWDSAYNDKINSAAVTGTTTKTLTLTQQDGGTVTASWTDDNTDAVTSVFGRTGAVVATEGDYSLTQLSDVTITSPSNGQVLKYNGTTWVNDTDANTGTVTSVGLSAPTGFSVTNSPVTSSGTLTLSFASGYSLPTTASQTNWDTAYTNRITSLTTTGSSGAATLVSNTLNIPNYTLAGLGGVSGSGTTNYIPKFTSSSAIGNSALQTDNNGNIFTISGDNWGTGAGGVNLSYNSNVGYLTTYYDATSLTLGAGISYKNGITISGHDDVNNITFRVNNSEQMRLTSTGLGIGTSSPNATLDVRTASNSLSFKSQSNDATAANNSGLLVYNTASATAASRATQLVLDPNGANAINSDYLVLEMLGNGEANLNNTKADGLIKFSTAATERMRLDASGNLGLGTSSPAEKLDVYDNSASNVSIKVGNTSGALQLLQGNGAAYLYTATNQPLIFSNNNSEKMRLDASGNLGLGTSSPAYKLDVNGNAHIGTGDSRLIIGDVVSANTESVIWLRTGSGKYAYSIAAQSLADESLTIARSTTQGGTTFTTASLTLNSSGNLGLGVTPSAWGSDYKAIQGGNGSNGVGGSFAFFNNLANGVILYSNAYNNNTNDIYTFTAPAAKYVLENNVYKWFQAPQGTAGNAITFTQAMTLFSTGNLAVGGTSDNGYKLDVSGTGRFTGDLNVLGSSSRKLTIGGTGAGNYGELQLGDGTQNNPYYLTTQVGGNNDGIAIKRGSSSFLSFASTGAATFSSSVTATSFNGTTNNIFSVSGTEGMRLTSTGLGIGTTSPTRLLDVNGVIRTQNAGSAGAPSIELGTSAQGNGLFYPTTNTIAISTNDTERMRITSGGDVAINTTTANSKLHVAGSLRLPLVTKSATYTLDATDYTVGFDCTGANRTANLPDATTCSGRIYVIYQFGGGSTYGVTIDGNSSQTINGSATYVLQGYCDYSSVMIQSDGSNWVVISDALQTGCL